MLITAVQRVICTFNEDFSPLNERGSKESGKRANEYPLEKSRMHAVKSSTPGASAMPHWHYGQRPLCRRLPYQKPHCPVCMIQMPRSKFVIAWVKTHVVRLFVQYATPL